MKPIDAIVLAGGFGTRLQSLSKGRPKSLMPVAEGVFLDYVLSWLAQYNIRKIYLSLYFKADLFRRYLKARNDNLKILPIVEPEPRGTGGAVKYILSKASVTSNFIVLNGDTFLDFNIDKMQQAFESSDSKAIMALSYVKNSSRYGRVASKAGIATRFLEKSASKAGWINSGCCMLQKKAFKGMPDKFSIEKDLYPRLVQDQMLAVYRTRGMFIDIGIPSDYRKFQSLMSGKKKS